MIVKSLLAKLRNKFQVSAAEVEDQDIHQSIVIGTAAIVPHSAQADSLMDEIVRFVEENTENGDCTGRTGTAVDERGNCSDRQQDAVFLQ